MAKIQDAANGQVAYITNQLKTTFATKVDLNKSWKLMTILIGANNICERKKKSATSLLTRCILFNRSILFSWKT
jgi:hypothetical protein